MTVRLQILIAVVAVMALLYIGNLVRVRRLELKYALIWFLVCFLLLIFDLVPGVLNWLTELLGITLPINMLFFLGFGFLLMIIFSQTMVISNLTRKVKRLTQETGMLNKRVDNRVEQTGEVSRRVEELEQQVAELKRLLDQNK